MGIVANTPEQETPTNFLATQVWPSARVAALAVERYMMSALDQKKRSNKLRTLCEFGCGPGLPSLTAARKLRSNYMDAKVYATDLDLLALDLVELAAKDQGIGEFVETRQFDLISDGPTFPQADLYLLSDVFESASVAEGAAKVTKAALDAGSIVWVFAQTDRAQREIFLQNVQSLVADPNLSWQPATSPPPDDSRLWLCDVDETAVFYG